MNVEIIAAIIVGISTIIGSVAAIFVDKPVKKPKYLSVNKNRRNALIGNWAGYFIQNGIEIPVYIYFECNKKKVEANITIHYPPEIIPQSDKSIESIKLLGGFFDRSFVKLDYWNKNDTVNQFGYVMLELDDQGTTIDGGILGYGHLKSKIGVAKAKIWKEGSIKYNTYINR